MTRNYAVSLKPKAKGKVEERVRTKAKAKELTLKELAQVGVNHTTDHQLIRTIDRTNRLRRLSISTGNADTVANTVT